MQVNLPRGMSAPDASSVVANITAQTAVEGKDIQDMTLDMAKAAMEQRIDAREALEAKSKAQEETAKEVQSQTLDRDTVKTVMIRTLNIVDLVMPSPNVKYRVVDEVDRVQVEVVKKDDGEVIRKIPEDKILELISRLHQVLNTDPEDSIDVHA